MPIADCILPSKHSMLVLSIKMLKMFIAHIEKILYNTIKSK